MSDLLSRVRNLHRPRLLVQAARAGQLAYDRNRDLKRLMRSNNAPSPDRAVSALLVEEERLEETRRAGDARYSLTHHIDLLIAMMAEIRLLPKPDGV